MAAAGACPGARVAGVGRGRWAPFSGLLGCQNPGSCGAGEATAEEIAEVEPGGAAGQPGVVLGRAAVAQFEAATTAAGDLGDDAFHVGPVLAVLLPQFGCGGPVAAGCAQQVVTLVQADGAAGLGGGAARQRAGSRGTAHRKTTLRVLVMGRVCPAGQLTVAACSSTVKSSTVNPPVTAAGIGLGLITASCPASWIAPRRSPVP